MNALAQPLRAALVLMRVLALTPAVLYGGTHAVEARASRTDAIDAGVDCSVGQRVRSTHAYIHAVIGEAMLRSKTFRGLVAAVEATDGIVYVEQGACKHNLRACLSLDVTVAGDYRILRVTVDVRQPDWDVMASIGHELKHALEVLENPGLVDATSVYLYYAERRDAKDRPFETKEAIDAGFAVRNEVSSFAKGRPN